MIGRGLGPFKDLSDNRLSKYHAEVSVDADGVTTFKAVCYDIYITRLLN